MCHIVASKGSVHLHIALGLLYESDLDVLVEELRPVNTKWKEVGWVFKISEKHLEAIHKRYGLPDDCLRETLLLWLKSKSSKNWIHVVGALRTVGEDNLCHELKRKYGELLTTESLLIILY